MKKLVIFIACIICFSPIFVFGASKPRLTLSTNSPFQGDVVKVTLENSGVAYAFFKNASVSFFPYNGNFVALIPIAGNEPIKKHILYVILSDGSLATRTIWIRAKKFSSVSLGIPKGSTLTTDTLVSNLSKEKVAIDEVVGKKTEFVYFNEQFQSPLLTADEITSPYGEIRKTGKTIIRHWGIDYKAKKGSEVYAISGGIVSKSYFDEIYGNTIIIDHGRGVFSLYMHLDERLKGDGELVRAGEKIGFVGNTGYSFGPHLHLSLKIHGISVDPERFIDVMKK